MSQYMNHDQLEFAKGALQVDFTSAWFDFVDPFGEMDLEDERGARPYFDRDWAVAWGRLIAGQVQVPVNPKQAGSAMSHLAYDVLDQRRRSEETTAPGQASLGQVWLDVVRSPQGSVASLVWIPMGRSQSPQP